MSYTCRSCGEEIIPHQYGEFCLGCGAEIIAEDEASTEATPIPQQDGPTVKK